MDAARERAAPKRVIVFGYDELLLVSLQAAAEAGADVAAVVFPSSRRDPPAESVRTIVRERGHRTLEQPPPGRTGDITPTLVGLDPDLHLVWSYPALLPSDWVRLPRRGSVNVHFGQLPRYRGANGIRAALAEGEDTTGVTLHYMDEGVDSGPIIDRATFPIHPDEDLLDLLRKGRLAGSMLLDHWLPRLLSRRVRSVPQDERLVGHPSRPMEAGRRIDWTAESVRIWNLVRSRPAPFPAAFTLLGDRRVLVRKVRPFPDDEPPVPGRISHVSQRGARVGTGEGTILLERVEIGGRGVDPDRFADVGITPGARFANA